MLLVIHVSSNPMSKPSCTYMCMCRVVVAWWLLPDETAIHTNIHAYMSVHTHGVHMNVHYADYNDPCLTCTCKDITSTLIPLDGVYTPTTRMPMERAYTTTYEAPVRRYPKHSGGRSQAKHVMHTRMVDRAVYPGMVGWYEATNH